MVVITEEPKLPFTSPFLSVYIGLKRSVRSQLKPKEMLTDDVALRLLKNVKWQSDLKAFFSKPIVVLTMGISLLALSIAIPHAAPFYLVFLRCFIACLSGCVLVYLFYEMQSRFLSMISEGYKTQSLLASQAIQQLEQERCSQQK